MEYLYILTDQMYKKKVYKENIELLKILKRMDPCSHVYEMLAECYQKVGEYVEAALCVDEACNRAPYDYASISNKQYYNLIEKLYSDYGIDFKIL